VEALAARMKIFPGMEVFLITGNSPQRVRFQGTADTYSIEIPKCTTGYIIYALCLAPQGRGHI
jgi:hypothetical protein